MPDPQGHDAALTELDKTFQRIRSEILKGAIGLAEAETDSEEDESKLDLDERRKIVEHSLIGIDSAVAKLKEILQNSNDQECGIKDGAALTQTIQQVGETIQTLRERLPRADADALKAYFETARVPLSDLINQWRPVKKIFIAVHGIGDQTRNATVQMVAERVCDYVGQPPALPLGRFHRSGATVTGAFLPVPDRDPAIDCGFAEIYWADVPRIPVDDQHILEDPKKWARALIGRLRMRGADDDATSAATQEETKRKDERIEHLIEELIQGVIIADRLVFLADKAGLFKFDLKKLLTDYLNDVQVVTEFEYYRDKMIRIFNDIFSRIHRFFYNSELYIVAHSEGTVVGFMGVLYGFSHNEEWVKNVKGLMTIGSPLHMHIHFWPELFEQFLVPDPPANRIAWRNYYDFGDPIGFDLKPMRDWMKARGWDPFFEFNGPEDIQGRSDTAQPGKTIDHHDYGFTRYYFPGAAHNDYWTDDEVFGHFIQEVVDPQQAVLPRKQSKPYANPAPIGLAWATSYLLPYVLAAMLLFVGSYALYKTVRGWLDPAGSQFETASQVSLNVLGLCGLFAGMSLFARIPRLTSNRGWIALSFALSFLCFGYLAMSPLNRESVEQFLIKGGNSGWILTSLYDESLLLAVLIGIVIDRFAVKLRPVLRTLLPVIVLVFVLRMTHAWFASSLDALPQPFVWSSLCVVLIAWMLGFRAWKVSWRYPHVGTKPLVHTGGLIIFMIIATQIAFHKPSISADQEIKLAEHINNQVSDLLKRLEKSETTDQNPFTDPDLMREAANIQNIQGLADLDRGGAPVWPVLLAGAAFLYLWWLAIVTFDLTFVWHLYIRSSGARRFMEEQSESHPLSKPSQINALGGSD